MSTTHIPCKVSMTAMELLHIYTITEYFKLNVMMKSTVKAEPLGSTFGTT
jgi:hypothetical protein